MRILFHSQASESYKKLLYCLACLQLDVCMMMQVQSIWESTYVTAYENKLEFNYPGFFCCCLVRRSCAVARLRCWPSCAVALQWGSCKGLLR